MSPERITNALIASMRHNRRMPRLLTRIMNARHATCLVLSYQGKLWWEYFAFERKIVVHTKPEVES